MKSDQFVLQGDGEEEEEEEAGEDGNMLKTDQSSTARAESGRKEPMRADLAERDDNGPLHRVIILGSAEVDQNQSFFFLIGTYSGWKELSHSATTNNHKSSQVSDSLCQF